MSPSPPAHPVPIDPHRPGGPGPWPPLVVFDRHLFDRLAAGQVSSDIAHLDDLAELSAVLEVLNPRGRDFGTDVADLVAFCLEHGALRAQYPITGVSIHPTVVGETRDGGFLVLITVAGMLALASDQTHPRTFADDPTDAARRVLATVAATGCGLYNAYQATTATLTPDPPIADTPRRSPGGDPR